MDTQLRERAADLGLQEPDIAEWEALVDEALVSALLGAVLTYEDALVELAS